MKKTNRNLKVLSSISLDSINIKNSVKEILEWAQNCQSKYITLCNVHSFVYAIRNKEFKKVLNKSDLNLPDGSPIALWMRLKGAISQERVPGPDLMIELLKGIQDQDKDMPIYLYGSTKEILKNLKLKLKIDYNLQNVFVKSPPFRELTEIENQEIVSDINYSKAKIIFVALGCPRQEIWMFKNRNNINGIMIGVGAAFDFHSGSIKRAPIYLQKIGLEWLYRLSKEPKRLFKRYLFSNLYFIYLFINEFIKR